MATRTINFLPKIFQTDHNKKFLNATLDQFTTEPNVARINGKIAGPDSFSKKEWPITAPTYILIPIESKDRDDVLKFFDWAKKNGYDIAKELDYIPL